MADLIDRNGLLEWLKVSDFENYSGDECFRYTMQEIENAPAVNCWIPCSERMPEIFDYVIGAGSDGICIVRYNGTLFADDSGATYPINAITHWMPLPEPPEEVQE